MSRTFPKVTDCSFYSLLLLFFVIYSMNFAVLSAEFISSLDNTWKWNTLQFPVTPLIYAVSFPNTLHNCQQLTCKACKYKYSLWNYKQNSSRKENMIKHCCLFHFVMYNHRNRRHLFFTTLRNKFKTYNGTLPVCISNTFKQQLQHLGWRNSTLSHEETWA